VSKHNPDVLFPFGSAASHNNDLKCVSLSLLCAAVDPSWTCLPLAWRSRHQLQQRCRQRVEPARPGAHQGGLAATSFLEITQTFTEAPPLAISARLNIRRVGAPLVDAILGSQVDGKRILLACGSIATSLVPPYPICVSVRGRSGKNQIEQGDEGSGLLLTESIKQHFAFFMFMLFPSF